MQHIEIYSDSKSINYPDSIYIIGGGRWAKVLIEVICGFIPPSVEISMHTLHNSSNVSTWVSENCFAQKVYVFAELPKFDPLKANVVIVANASRDHYKTAMWAISAKVPVLVEKPLALTLDDCLQLKQLSKHLDIPLAVSQIFLFTRYLETFTKVVNKSGNIQTIKVFWSDPKKEIRYGECKKFDPGLPIYIDLLPHVLSIIGSFLPFQSVQLNQLDYQRAGALLKLDIRVNEVPCQIYLERNGSQRQRLVKVNTDKNLVQLDFSKEPGSIISFGKVTNGDPEWEIKEKPIERMLKSFFSMVSNKKFDNSLQLESTITASIIIDQISNLYSSAQKTCLIETLSAKENVTEDLFYLLNEIFQYDGGSTAKCNDEQIAFIRNEFNGVNALGLLEALRNVQNHVSFITNIAKASDSPKNLLELNQELNNHEP